MKHLIRRAAGAAAIALSGLAVTSAPARAYPVDCAILLCLAGGWPSSAPCAQARAEFIRRITPWPVEPPLQIWRCPMGAAYNTPAPRSPMERLHDAAFRDAPPMSLASDTLLVPVQVSEQADVDISDDAFDFVRSIRVYHIQFSQRVNAKGDCVRTDSTRRGLYGPQGGYRWTRSSVEQVPAASALPDLDPDQCRGVSYRAVFVDWRDHAGNYGFEEVRY